MTQGRSRREAIKLALSKVATNSQMLSAGASAAAAVLTGCGGGGGSTPAPGVSAPQGFKLFNPCAGNRRHPASLLDSSRLGLCNELFRRSRSSRGSNAQCVDRSNFRHPDRGSCTIDVHHHSQQRRRPHDFFNDSHCP